MLGRRWYVSKNAFSIGVSKRLICMCEESACCIVPKYCDNESVIPNPEWQQMIKYELCHLPLLQYYVGRLMVDIMLILL